MTRMERMERGTWFLIALALICMAILIAMPAKVEAQPPPKVPAAVQTRTAEIVDKAKALGQGEQAQEAVDGVAAFRATAQAGLNAQLGVLANPTPRATPVPSGYGQRIWKCVENRWGRARCGWMVKTGR